MSKWAESKYEGEQLEGWFHGKGKYYFPSGVIYEGDFFKGEFHGEGILIFPNGGQYKAKWEHGKMLEGTYYFDDHLKYEHQDWAYCNADDRRFHQEIKQSIKPTGVTQMTKDDQPFEIPQGTYDVGEGYYEPVKSIIYKYDGSIHRTPSENEVEFILKKCRYNPKQDCILSGENDKTSYIYRKQLYLQFKETFKFVYKPSNARNKNDLQNISQLLKRWPNEVQQFRQYCINSKVYTIGDLPKYVYIITKGEFAVVKYVKSQSKNPLAYLSKIFAHNNETNLQKQTRILKIMDTFGLDEIYNDKYTYEMVCQSTIGEVFCIKRVVFEKILEKKSFQRKINLQIDIEQLDKQKPQVMEIQSAKGSTPMSRLQLGLLPRPPEEISTHRHEKRTIDFNLFRNAPIKKQPQQIKVISEEEIDEPPLNNKFLGGNQLLQNRLKKQQYCLIYKFIYIIIQHIYQWVQIVNHVKIQEIKNMNFQQNQKVLKVKLPYCLNKQKLLKILKIKIILTYLIQENQDYLHKQNQVLFMKDNGYQQNKYLVKIRNKRDGFGIQKWNDGAMYEGEWKQDKACGKGKFYHADGDIYEGEWLDDKAHGYGTYIKQDGSIYKGNWKQDFQDGQGIEEWIDGSKYEGEYSLGKRQGFGSYYWADGKQYIGEWQNNKISGKGIQNWNDGRQYNGYWYDNMMHGEGIYIWPDGRKYEGEYYLDKKHGFGIFYWTDGKKYIGQWKQGKQHGQGKLVLKNGIEKIGYWEKGKKIRWIDDESIY